MRDLPRKKLVILQSALCLLAFSIHFSRITAHASLEHPERNHEDKSSAFLLLCLTDGSLVSMNAWTGELETRISTDPLLQKQVRTPLSDDTAAIVPGLDGRLYSFTEEDGFQPQLHVLPLTIHSILDHPVRSCPGETEEDCGILTATAQTSLLALDSQGQLLWKSQGEENDTSNAAGGSSSLLLQRRDYWVQHVSVATGLQDWNVSLGTYQALDFSSGGTEEASARIDDDDDLSDDGDPGAYPGQSSFSASRSELPSIVFSDEGHTVAAIDPATEEILWKQTTRSVLSSVFGINHGHWQPLNVLETPEEDDLSTDSILDQFALTRNERYDQDEKEVWSNAAWEAARLQYRREYDGSRRIGSLEPQRLLPSKAPGQELTDQQCTTGSCNSLMESQCLAGECKPKHDFLLPTFSPAQPPNQATVQPTGILLSYELVLYLCIAVMCLALGLRKWYLSKKEKWLQENSSVSSTRRSMPFMAPNSLEHSTQSIPSRFRRSASMPECMAGIPPFRNKSDPGDLLRRAQSDSIETFPSHSKEEETQEDSNEEVTQGLAGIPLVNRSRYATDYEEIEAMGKGGFGTVFRCKNKLDGREYAIKKITIQGVVGLKSFDKRLKRVLREVVILAALEHPNIVRYFTAWLEYDTTPEANAKGSTEETSAFDESTMISRRFSSTNLMSDSVSQWDIPSPPRCGVTYQPSPNPLAYDKMFDETSESLRQNITTGEDDFSFWDESNNDHSSGHDVTKTRDVLHDEKVNVPDTSKPAGVTTTYEPEAEGSPEGGKEDNAGKSIRHTVYIQMQLCSQSTVAEYLTNEAARKGSAEDGVDIPSALQLFLQISQAVQYIHDSGLIHRDLKPSNCFMDSSGSIKVGDFGLSRGASTDEEVASSTLAGRRDSMGVTDGHTAGVGTRTYASPEQTNASDYDSSTDVYSLGIILFELCYPMYTGMERNICLSRLRDYRFPDDWEKKVGAAFPTLKGLITRMLSKKPAERPTAETIVTEIQSILGEFTILSLDSQHGPEVILLRVEAENRDDALGHTIKLIRSASEGSTPVKVVQYGLRSAFSNNQPASIMEFALESSNPRQQGPELVSRLAVCPEIFKVRQVSHSSNVSSK